MDSSSRLKTSLAPLSQYDSFYEKGKIQTSSDGKYLFCGYGSRKVNIFNIETGSVEFVIEEEGEDDDRFDIRFILSPNDEHLITTSKLKTLQQWDWKENKVVRTWKSEPNSIIVSMAFDKTSTLLATGNIHSEVKVWDIVNKYSTNLFTCEQGMINLVEFHPDGRHLFSVADDNVIRLWSLEEKKCIEQLPGHYSAVTSLQFTDDGAFMYSASRDSTVFVWDMKTYERKNTIPVYEAVESLVLLPKIRCAALNITTDDDHFVTAGNRGMLKVWSTAKRDCVFKTPQLITRPDGSEDDDAEVQEHGFVFAAYSKALDSIVTMTYDGNFILYNRNGFTLSKQIASNNGEIYCAKFFGEDQNHVAVATNSSAIKVFNVNDWTCQILLGHSDMVMSLDTCEIDGVTHVVTGSKDKSIRVWKKNKAQCFECMAIGSGHSSIVSAVSFRLRLPGIFVVSGGMGHEDFSLKLWEYVPGRSGKAELRLLKDCQAHKKDVDSIDVSPDGRYIASGSQDKTAKVWDAESLSCKGTLQGHTRGVRCVMFHPSDHILGTSSADKTIKLWELKNFKCVKTFEGHEESVLTFNFLSRGLQLISSGADGLLKLWSVQTNECLKTYDKHEAKIWTLAVNKAEDRFVTGGADSRMILWKDITQEEVEEQRIKDEERRKNEEQLENLLKDKKFKKAFRLSILLGQPRRALNTLKEIWKMPTRDEYLAETLRPLRMDQIQTVLEFVSIWNKNSKHSHVAQAVLATTFKVFGPDRLLEFPEIQKLIECLIPYSERHHNRLKLMEQKADIVDFICLSISTLEPMDMEH